MNRRNLTRLLLLCIASMAAMVVVEAGMHVAFERLPVPFLLYAHRALKDQRPAVWERLREYAPYLNLRREDRETGWTFKPSMLSQGANEENQAFNVTTSGEGFFTPDVPAKSAPQLVTLGDSFLSTFYVPEPIAWSLRRNIGMPVYNLAVHGWGPESYRAAYLKFAKDRTHKQVVVFSFMNDVNDVGNWMAWKGEERPGISFLSWIQATNPDANTVNTGESWFDSHSILWNFVKQVWLRRWPKSAPQLQAMAVPVAKADEARVERFSTKDGGSFPLQLARGYAFLTMESDAFVPGGGYYPYLQAYFESLERLRATIRAQGAQMVLVWIPSKERVYIPLLPPERRSDYVTNKSGDIGGIEPVVAAFATETGTPFLDLTPALSTMALEGAKLYFTVDGHLNGLGNEVAGRLAAEFVRSIPALPPAPAVAVPHLMFRRGPLSLTQRLTLEAGVSRASLVTAAASGWQVKGRAESQFSYLLQWPNQDIADRRYLVARGFVRRGGLTIGLLENDKWAQQINVTTHGRFDLAIPVAKSGSYTVIIANCLPAGALENDFEVTEIGWAESQ